MKNKAMKKKLLAVLLIGFTFAFPAEPEKRLSLYPPGALPTSEFKDQMKWNRRINEVPKKLYFVVANSHLRQMHSFLSTQPSGAPFIHGTYGEEDHLSWDTISLHALRTTDQWIPMDERVHVTCFTKEQAEILKNGKDPLRELTILELDTTELVGLFKRKLLGEGFFGRRVPRDALVFFEYEDALIRTCFPLRACTELLAAEEDPIHDEWVSVSIK